MTKNLYHFIRHLAGYAVGISVFVILIPIGIWYLTQTELFIFEIPIISLDCVRTIVSALFFIPGIIFVVWSNLFLLFKGKGGPTDLAGIKISPQTEKLVTDGPYTYTRNPMAFGVNAIYLSVAIYFNSLGCLLVLLIFFFIMVRYIVFAEEKRLLNDFGNDYVKYKEKTPMFIPVPKRKTRRSDN